MMPNKGIVVPLLAIAHALLISLVAAQDSALLNLGFFTDNQCTTRSTINPNATLGVSICAATLGALSIYVPTFPCSGSNVQLLGFTDTGCKQSSGSFFGDSNGCYEWFGGSFGSIVLTCNKNSNSLPGAIVSYTTISVGPLAADATGAAAADPTSVGGFTPTGTSSSSGSGSSTGTSSTGNTNSSGSGSNGSSSQANGFDALSIGAKVGIIVGAIVAGVIIIFMGWCIWHRERKHRFDRMIAMQQHEASIYRPSTYFPTTAPLNSPPHTVNGGYAPSRYPVTEVDWQAENAQSRYNGSEYGAPSNILSWQEGTHTIHAPTQH